MRVLLFVVILTSLGGCSAYIGIPSDPEAQPWRSIYIFSFYTIIVIPFISVCALVFSMWKTLSFKLKLERYLNFSVIVIGALWLLGEMSLTQKTNIRIDLLFTIPAIGIQLFTVVIGGFIANRAEKASNNNLKRNS